MDVLRYRFVYRVFRVRLEADVRGGLEGQDVPYGVPLLVAAGGSLFFVRHTVSFAGPNGSVLIRRRIAIW